MSGTEWTLTLEMGALYLFHVSESCWQSTDWGPNLASCLFL